ncbi:MAG: DoxX family protein [Chlamydiota bacterium]|nr:DoxX family protein [Chlamydiota bacterium]
MAIFQSMRGFYEGLISLGNFVQHLLLLAMRLYWGYAFHLVGWNKFQNIEGVAGFFAGLGIPFPEMTAYFVAGVELIGGWCLIVGFASRLVSIPLAITMITALLMAHFEGAAQILSDPGKFVIQAPVSYLITSLVVFAFGPGWISMDYLLEGLVFKKK